MYRPEENREFVGFAVDLVEKIAEKAGFDYKLHLVADNSYGRMNQDGKWDGVIGEVVDKVILAGKIDN